VPVILNVQLHKTECLALLKLKEEFKQYKSEFTSKTSLNYII